MMIHLQKRFASVVIFLSLLLYACHETEDPGPLQAYEKEYALTDFDRLEMGSAFHITVEEASTFNIKVRGDRRNINDLEVLKNGGTLTIRYRDNNNRKHDTYITITMPVLKAVNFSGASVSVIKGFESEEQLDFYLSGASVSQLEAGYREMNLFLSGASKLSLYGLGDVLRADISGASVLTAFDFPVRQAKIAISGASHGKVTVSDALEVAASGASGVLFRGSPLVTAETSGASKVEKD